MHQASAYTLDSTSAGSEEAAFQLTEPRHLKLTGAPPGFGFERCEDAGCNVASDGTASSCGRVACPSCGCGGTNLRMLPLLEAEAGVEVHCTCGYAWVREVRHPALVALSL
jgi:hypothetical protein